MALRKCDTNQLSRFQADLMKVDTNKYKNAKIRFDLDTLENTRKEMIHPLSSNN